MFGFVNVVGASLRESTRTAQGNDFKVVQPVPSADKKTKPKG